MPWRTAVRPPARQLGATGLCGKTARTAHLPQPYGAPHGIPTPHRCGDPIKAGTDERGEEPNPVPLVRGSFQAARGHEADESTPRVQRIIVRKIRRNLYVIGLNPKTIC
jgi:hypothetical protein